MEDGLPVVGCWWLLPRDPVIKDTVQNICMSNILYTVLILSLPVNHICHIVSEFYTQAAKSPQRMYDTNLSKRVRYLCFNVVFCCLFSIIMCILGCANILQLSELGLYNV